MDLRGNDKTSKAIVLNACEYGTTEVLVKLIPAVKQSLHVRTSVWLKLFLSRDEIPIGES